VCSRSEKCCGCRYVAAAVELGVRRDDGEEQLSDEFIGSVVEAVRPHRADGPGEAWRLLVANHELVEDWLKKDGLTVRKRCTLARLPGAGSPTRMTCRRSGPRTRCATSKR
jgi:hypothetical protein